MKRLLKALKCLNGNLEKNFAPEFINRIDEILMFKPLSKENIHDIVKPIYTTKQTFGRE